MLRKNLKVSTSKLQLPVKIPFKYIYSPKFTLGVITDRQTYGNKDKHTHRHAHEQTDRRTKAHQLETLDSCFLLNIY